MQHTPAIPSFVVSRGRQNRNLKSRGNFDRTHSEFGCARYTTDVQLVQISANVGQTSLWQLPTKATTFARGGSWRACVRAWGAAEREFAGFSWACIKFGHYIGKNAPRTSNNPHLHSHVLLSLAFHISLHSLTHRTSQNCFCCSVKTFFSC